MLASYRVWPMNRGRLRILAKSVPSKPPEQGLRPALAKADQGPKPPFYPVGIRSNSQDRDRTQGQSFRDSSTFASANRLVINFLHQPSISLGASLLPDSSGL